MFCTDYHFNYLSGEFLGLNINVCYSFQNLIVYKIPWPESESELYRPSDGHLSTRLAPTFADRTCHVVSVRDP
jgi:hypothetical protein